MLDVVLDVH